MLSFPQDRIHIPDRLKPRIKIITKCCLKGEEILAINGALYALDIAISRDASIHPSSQINAIFTDRSLIEIPNSNPGIAGITFTLAVYYVERWHSLHFDQFMMIATVLEEFCHYFWTIADEVLVLDKVQALLHLLVPDEPEIDRRIQAMKEIRQLGYPC